MIVAARFVVPVAGPVIEGGAVPRCPIIDALFDAAAVRPS